MAPDFPSDLIRDIQIRMRQVAGVPSYDPGDPALPSVPSVDEAVTALDPSLPDYLRCKRCHGGLLRGINSTLCIFCGSEQRREGISRSIPFNSSAGYLKLLQSLDLGGSEMVNLEVESKESSKVQDSQKGGLTLSNFLDLELRWPREVEEIDNSSSSKVPSQLALANISGVNLDNFFSHQKNEVSSSTSHTTSNAPQVSAHDGNLVSVDLDTFLPGPRNETASSAQNETAEQFMPREKDVNTPTNLSSTSQKFGFFEERQSLDVLNSSADAKGGDSDDAFTDWETDFQSASSATFETKSKQIDPFQNSADVQSANLTAITVEYRTIDLFQNTIDYQSANYETVRTESKEIDPSQNSSNFQSDNPTDCSMESRKIDLFQNSVDFLSANSETVATDSRHSDLFQNSAGFQSTKFETLATESTQNSSDAQSTNSGTVATDSKHIDHFQNSGTGFYSYPIITSESDQSTNTGHNLSKDGSGRDLTREVDQLVSHNDWFQDDMWSHISTKVSKEADQLENISSSFVGEVKNEEKETTSVSISCSRDDLLLRSSANEINTTKSLNHHDDLFDDWQDFTTSTNTKGSLSSLQPLTSDKIHVLPSEANSGDPEDLEFGSFTQSDSFSDALNDLQSSSDVNSRQGGGSVAHSGTNQSNEKTGNASTVYRGSNIGENIPVASDLDASKYKVDMLLAQMPDLSFMLEESLCIPKKPSSSELNT